jgi:membrane protease subunit HflC
MKGKGFIIFIAAAVIIVLYMSAYVVDETRQVVITQFGKVVGEPVTEPGLRFILPFVQKATYFPKNLQDWDGDPSQVPTLEKTYIWVDTFARWRIVDPVLFFQTVGSDLDSGKARLNEIIDPAVRDAIASYRLIETVRKSNRTLDTLEEGDEETMGQDQTTSYAIDTGREKITREILSNAQPKVTGFGIELVDVKIKRINYTEQVRTSVYDRMVAERNQIAEKYRSEGQGEARKILGDKERDLKEIKSEAYRKAQEIMGKADAEATRIYADSFGVDPEFYSFTKTLEAYSETMDNSSSLVLSTDSAFFKYMKEYSPAE